MEKNDLLKLIMARASSAVTRAATTTIMTVVKTTTRVEPIPRFLSCCIGGGLLRALCGSRTGGWSLPAVMSD
jgi:hypothetical protein